MRTDSPDSNDRLRASSAVKRFTLAVAFASLWLIAIGTLSFLTANPVTLNLEQIHSAYDVLTAVVEDAKAGTIRVEKSWKAAVSEDRLVLPNLNAENPTSGNQFLIPVTKSQDGWRVTRSKLPGEPPLIYPATPESEAQLRQLLKTGR